MPVAAQSATSPATPDFARARFNMVESQIRPNKVRNPRLLEAMGRLPREMFVSAPMAGLAYIDEDIEVAPGRFMLEPMVLARLAEEAHIRAEDRVLDIAPGTGYSTALLASLAKEVIALENDPFLVNLIDDNLMRLGIANARAQQGTPAEGWPPQAPYNVILINGSIELLPPALTAQLAEGGKLLAVVREYGPAQAAHKGEARLYEKLHGAVSHRPLFDANIPPLAGFEARKSFSF